MNFREEKQLDFLNFWNVDIAIYLTELCGRTGPNLYEH